MTVDRSSSQGEFSQQGSRGVVSRSYVGPRPPAVVAEPNKKTEQTKTDRVLLSSDVRWRSCIRTVDDDFRVRKNDINDDDDDTHTEE